MVVVVSPGFTMGHQGHRGRKREASTPGQTRVIHLAVPFAALFTLLQCPIRNALILLDIWLSGKVGIIFAMAFNKIKTIKERILFSFNKWPAPDGRIFVDFYFLLY